MHKYALAHAQTKFQPTSFVSSVIGKQNVKSQEVFTNIPDKDTTATNLLFSRCAWNLRVSVGMLGNHRITRS